MYSKMIESEVQLPDKMIPDDEVKIENESKVVNSDKDKQESPPESPSNINLGSLLHAGANKGKLRGDVDQFSFLKDVSKKSRPKTPPSPVPSSKASSPKAPRSAAQNIFTHLKTVSDRIEREDEHDRFRRRKHSSRSSSRKSYRKCSGSRKRESDNDAEEKATLLQTYHILQAQGVKSDMKLDLSVDYITLKTEVTRMQTQLNSQKCIKFARKFLIAAVSGLEFLNSKYDPFGFHLNGWSEHVMTTLGDYDSCFMRLYDKYKDHTSSVSPEVELLLLLGGSGLMFHLTQAFINQNVPKFTEVAKESPELAEKIAGIMASKYGKAEEPPDSSDSEDDRESVSTQTFNRTISRMDPNADKPQVMIPTEMLSTPAFPALIERSLNQVQQRPVPKLNIQPKLTKLETIKEIDIASKPAPSLLKHQSENVLVLEG